uniref:Uncharacterized protein n=1 Tax=uncultured marine virus TaxID=186617 RepID=A0A0F7L7G7_9VIRU|nr:hypothetical protein [uncultured marine virus]
MGNWPKLDLFGVKVDPEKKTVCHMGGAPKKNPYPAPPGSGPKGHNCRDCGFKVRFYSGDKGWYKCLQKKHEWAGPATDIKLRSKACSFWVPEDFARKSEILNLRYR